MDQAEIDARASCKAEGLDPDEKIFVQDWDPSPDAEPVIHAGSGVIRGVNRPRWKSYLQKGAP
jgi:hypothetical protein